jgi:hypothetical protein
MCDCLLLSAGLAVSIGFTRRLRDSQAARELFRCEEALIKPIRVESSARYARAFTKVAGEPALLSTPTETPLVTWLCTLSTYRPILLYGILSLGRHSQELIYLAQLSVYHLVITQESCI